MPTLEPVHATAGAVAAAASMPPSEAPGLDSFAVDGLMGEVPGNPLLGWDDGGAYFPSPADASSVPAVASMSVRSGRFLEGERGSNAGSVLTCRMDKHGDMCRNCMAHNVVLLRT